MSTILDALKKSEQERKRNNIPTLSDMPTPEEERGGVWVWIVSSAIIALLLAMIVWLLWGRTSVTSDQASPQEVEVSNETIANEEAQTGLRVNVVSWSNTPAQRFVIVDGKLAREGEFLRPGLKVETIKQNSVVLIDRGERVEVSP